MPFESRKSLFSKLRGLPASEASTRTADFPHVNRTSTPAGPSISIQALARPSDRRKTPDAVPNDGGRTRAVRWDCHPERVSNIVPLRDPEPFASEFVNELTEVVMRIDNDELLRQ